MTNPTSEHVFETAPSARSKCRSCGAKIDKEALRFGERMPNPFSDGDMTQWHHPDCAAHRRPDPLLEALNAGIYPGEDAVTLKTAAEHASTHRRLQRIGAAQKASSGRARCRHCRELIEKDAWRLPLIFFEEGSYNGSGFIHASCVADYCETQECWPTVEQFAAHLESSDLDDLRSYL